MITAPGHITKTTTPRAVIPFYIYAGLCFLVATILLLFSSDAFQKHYFHPNILAITHLMAIGWGTMIIFGASHQLVPVIVEGKLFSEKLAYVTFGLAAVGIPLLVYGFFKFDMGIPAKWGGRLVVISILCYLINLGKTITKGKSKNVHAVFVFTGTVWLFLTAFFGLALVYNFTYPLMPHDSVHYLPLHVHAGVVGWFLLLVMGVGSRLIPMFLVSKYTNARLLWMIYGSINTTLISYVFIFYFVETKAWVILPGILLLLSIALFVMFCYKAYRFRIRKQIDVPMKVSLLSVLMMTMPIMLMFVIIFSVIVAAREKTSFIVAYGFMIFFGWITAIILGMTFKTLPFIVWNKVYHHQTFIGKAPNPKDLVHPLFLQLMTLCYITGFILFTTGILLTLSLLLQSGALLLLLTAISYNLNVFKIVTHRSAL